MKKDIAIFTIVKNDGYFLKKWIHYYKNYFDNSDIYVLDHDTTDGSTNNLDVNVIKISNSNTLSSLWGTNQVVEFAAKLLNNYKYFFHVDSDEFVLTKDGTNLKIHINNQINQNKNCIICTGYDLIHNYTKESLTFNTSLPILFQRNYIKRNENYDKPIIANYILNYNVGDHSASNEIPYSVISRNDPNLIMLHAKRYDRTECINRIKARCVDSNYTNDDPEGHQCLKIQNEIDKFLNENFLETEHSTFSHIDSILNYDYKYLF